MFAVIVPDALISPDAVIWPPNIKLLLPLKFAVVYRSPSTLTRVLEFTPTAVAYRNPKALPLGYILPEGEPKNEPPSVKLLSVVILPVMVIPSAKLVLPIETDSFPTIPL